jgi:hypothetical protein
MLLDSFDKTQNGRPCNTKHRNNGEGLPLVKCSTCVGRSHDEEQRFRSEDRYCHLLNGYLLNLHRGPAEVQSMIRRDLQGMQELGAYKYALDLKIVLECFLAEFPTRCEVLG